MIQCCSVAGLGFGRGGSYEYYLSEPIVENDLNGVGPLILAGIELQELLGLPMKATHDIKASAQAKLSVAKEWNVITTRH